LRDKETEEPRRRWTDTTPRPVEAREAPWEELEDSTKATPIGFLSSSHHSPLASKDGSLPDPPGVSEKEPAKEPPSRRSAREGTRSLVGLSTADPWGGREERKKERKGGRKARNGVNIAAKETITTALDSGHCDTAVADRGSPHLLKRHESVNPCRNPLEGLAQLVKAKLTAV